MTSDHALQQLFIAHGGMKLVMALHEYEEALVKEEAAHVLKTFKTGEAGSQRLPEVVQVSIRSAVACWESLTKPHTVSLSIFEIILKALKTCHLCTISAEKFKF